MHAAQQMKDEWVMIGLQHEIPQLGSRVVKTPQGDIAVFRAADDHLFAMRDRCPHKGGPLSQGIVYGHTVACPLHNWCMDMNKGEAIGPDEGCVPTYPVKVEDNGMVFLSLTPSGTCVD